MLLVSRVQKLRTCVHLEFASIRKRTKQNKTESLSSLSLTKIRLRDSSTPVRINVDAMVLLYYYKLRK